MNTHLAYFIDSLEVRLKGAKAAHDWDEVDNIYKELQKLYNMQTTYTHITVAS